MDFLAKQQIQDEHCDWSVGTPKGARILRNVGRVARFFPLGEKILCVGSGDGTEMLIWRALGYRVFGVEISNTKAQLSDERGEFAMCEDIEDTIHYKRGCNIYCAHTLEHLGNPEKFLNQAISQAPSTVCVIFPIEINGSKNPSHLSPISSIKQIEHYGKVRHSETLFDNEPQGMVIF